MYHNNCHTKTYWEDLRKQKTAVEDQRDPVGILEQEKAELDEIFEEELVHKGEVSVLS